MSLCPWVSPYPYHIFSHQPSHHHRHTLPHSIHRHVHCTIHPSLSSSLHPLSFFSHLSLLFPTEYIFYCKRAILFISSSNILTPHPPLRPASLSFPRNKGGGVHTRRAVRVGEGFNILEDAKHRIGLLKYNLSAGTSSVKDNVSSLGETFQKI